MAGVNPDFDSYETDELMIGKRLNAAERAEQNFVMDGLGLTDAGGLLLEVGAGFGYIVGYEVELAAPDFVALTDAATNYVFFGFTRTPDAAPPTSVLSITPDIVVNTTGTSPGTDYVLLGTVVTAGASISSIDETDLRRFIGPAQLSENLEGNHNQIQRMVAHKGTALPAAAPPTTEGQLFFRTTDKKYFIYNGAAWIELATAAAPPPPGAITLTNDEISILEDGELVRISPGMPGSVLRASGAAESESGVVGAVIAPIAPAAPGDVASVQGVLTTIQFETGLALTEGETVFLSPSVAGAATNVAPVIIGTVIKVVAIIVDASGYFGTIPADSKAVCVLGLEQATVVT